MSERKKKKTVKRVRLAEERGPSDDEVLSEFVAEGEARAASLREFQDAEMTNPPPRGRPSTYNPRYANIARILCSKGATDAELADAFGVSTTQIKNWQTMHPDFGEAVRYGKCEVFDPKVERALAQKALGYTVDCEEVKITKDGDIIRYPIRKHYPPDTTAAIFWLKNRQPEKWRDVWKIDHQGKVDVTTTSEQLLAEIRKDIEELGLAPRQVAAMGLVPFPKDRDGTKH